MARVIYAICLPFMLLSLSACGFKPLYGNYSATGRAHEDLQTIAISPIGTSIGPVVRNNLLDRMSPAGAPDTPHYRLDVILVDSKTGLGVRLDASVTRFNYNLVADYALIDQETGQSVFTSSSRSQVAYDVVQSQFATVIAEQDAQKRAARDVSEDIALRLALYFSGDKSSAAQEDISNIQLDDAPQPAPPASDASPIPDIFDDSL